MNLSIASVKAFYKNEAHLALMAAVLVARERAAEVRAEVDSYIEPLFAMLSRSHGLVDEYTGEPITRSKDLYMSDDDTFASTFYAACDEAHKDHGWNLPEGHCPALTAENLATEAERELLKAAAKHYGIPLDGVLSLELRAKALDLFLNPPMA
jgi:hypothetical protein